MQKIYVAGGCFWGVQEYFRRVKGVFKTESYYLNGGFDNVSYKEVCSASGHVEAVEIIYDENILKVKDIFYLLTNIVNPFSLNKQGNDVGIQYRIGFYVEKDRADDLNLIREYIKEFETKFNQKTTFETEIVKDKTRAEEYHQDYLIKNKNGYCHIDLSNIPDQFLDKSKI
ncbi:peptide-methionine (S)-S-oxide reductase [Mycoplasma testudineum]|uniref:Peptide methionine sulfoxide reductase MsrA n=1 Tax=Mycoplasma testudineum TaxID=244584 RepID=A0A4V3C2T5_9MOLU|nr:peptide-methionine (S)-S-oxide reductase [Mycoplasma testudineum]